MIKLFYFLVTFIFLVIFENSPLCNETNIDKTERKDEVKDQKKELKKDQDCEKEEKAKDSQNTEGEKKESDEEKPLKIGNLALPSSQQPGSLVSFGENIVDKDTVQLFLFGDFYNRHKGYFIDLIPSILWGVSDQFSIFFNVPIAPQYKERNNRSSGLEDVFVQFEYVFYNKESRCYTNQATVVFNVTFPTGSSRVKPPTGFGAPSCLIGGTYNHTAIDWLYFGAIGSILTSSTKECTKLGSQLLYEFGFGHNIPSPKGWIYAWMVEFDGVYALRNRMQGQIDPNSGGVIIFATPSIWISSEKIVFQLGAGCPVYQRLYGNQIRYTYQVVFNLGYTF